jgi:cytochrome c oxidase cbb3-type subunit III
MRPCQILLFLSVNTNLALGTGFVWAQTEKTDAALGAQRFMEFCAGCHGADGRGGDKAPSLVSLSNPAARSDTELLRIVHDGTTGGMPPFAQIGNVNIEAVVHYVRLLQGESASTKAASGAGALGNADAGRELYFGKAHCSACHLMQGKGGFIACDLTAYGRNRYPDAIRRAITNPDDPLVRSSQVVKVTTSAGKNLTGVLRNEDNFTVALQSEDGRYHLFPRSDLREVQYTGHSLMPRDYAKRLTPKELDDLVSFIIAAGSPAHDEATQDH